MRARTWSGSEGTPAGPTPWPFSPPAPTCWPWPTWTISGPPQPWRGPAGQIGVNVLPEHRGRGLAVRLTALLKDALLDRGVVPFYGTALSHTASLNVARRAGLRPAWAEVWACPLDRMDGSL